jgi:imidazolonepropionase-like amidohydrolase
VGWLRTHGVTTIHTGPSPGKPIGGRSLVTRTTAGDVDAIALRPDGWIVMTLGEGAKNSGSRTRMGAAAVVRQALTAAREYQTRMRLPLADRPTIDLGKQVLAEAIGGERRVVVHAHRADDIHTALRIATEFELDMVLAGSAEAYLVRDALAKAGVPVLVGPVMMRSWGYAGERANHTFENAALLQAAGVQIGFMSGFEGYVPKVRVVLWEAAIAAANGLGFDDTLAALTLGNASVLGIEDRVGSLDVGKRGDVVLFDGDPFEYTTHVCGVVIDGVVASEQCH